MDESTIYIIQQNCRVQTYFARRVVATIRALSASRAVLRILPRHGANIHAKSPVARICMRKHEKKRRRVI